MCGSCSDDVTCTGACICHLRVFAVAASCLLIAKLVHAGLTKLLSNLSKDGNWAKALEIYESLDAIGVRPDTTITNAAISCCDKGGQWQTALEIFDSMPRLGMSRDAITYSAVISALAKGRQWGLAIDVFNNMVYEGVECDAVTCCSLITALDKGGQWQLAEQVGSIVRLVWALSTTCTGCVRLMLRYS